MITEFDSATVTKASVNAILSFKHLGAAANAGCGPEKYFACFATWGLCWCYSCFFPVVYASRRKGGRKVHSVDYL